jgi:DNA-binding Xre family transcriptional regulator
MKFCELIDKTITEFRLSARELAQSAGMTEAALSEFRRGKRVIKSDTLENLIAALPDQARQYLFCTHLISDKDDRAIGVLLYAIGIKMQGTSVQMKEEPELKLTA